MCRLDAFELSAFERAVMTTKSVLLATRLVMEYTSPEKCDGRYGVEGISHLASLEVRFQTSMWGEVEDSMNPSLVFFRTTLTESARCGLRRYTTTVRECSHTSSSIDTQQTASRKLEDRDDITL